MTEIGQHSQIILQKTILIFTLGQIKKKRVEIATQQFTSSFAIKWVQVESGVAAK